MRNLNKLLACAMALAVPLCTWAQTESEPNDGSGTADTLFYNTAMTGSMGPCNPTNNSGDYFRVIPTLQGQIRLQSSMSNTGPTDLEVTFQLRGQTTSVITTFTLTAGANGIPVSDSFQLPCHGGGGIYFFSLGNPSTTVCTNYTLTYDFVAPVFANDPEPNNGGGSAIPVVANTWQEGQVNFNYGDNADYFRLDLPTNGVLNIEWEAEHAGSTVGSTAAFTLRQSSTAAIQSWTVPVGANSIPAVDLASITCRSNTGYYILSIGSNICGTSYRFRYNVTAPVFANDPEPNNGTANSPTPVAHNTDQDGQTNFLTYTDNSDYYVLTLPTDGVLAITVQMEHVGTDAAATATVNLRQTGSSILQTWTVPVGANATPVTTVLTRNCMGASNIYYISIVSNICGTSYRFSYNVTPPVFANDLEPNNTQFQVALHDLDSVPLEGHLGFHYDGSNDGYLFNHPGDSLFVDISAEHAGVGTGLVLLEMRNTPFSALIQDTLLTVGGGSVPLRDTVYLGVFPAQTFRFNLEPVTCGVSYKYHCKDDDNDGICNAFDECPNTPLDDDVSANGCSCSQLTVDDGDPCTLDECTNGIVTNTFQDADADGTCDADDLCPGGPEPGTACNDNDACTTGDVIGVNCLCAGTFADADADGTCDADDLCPGGPEPGTACNDNNANTVNDIIQANCLCAGTLVGSDCEGVPGGPAVPGTACNDNDACTVNDIYLANCLCAGTFADADADGTCDANDLCPGGPEPGTACNDNDACTTGDVIGTNCLCAGTFADADADGTCDADDQCPSGPEPGTVCNDNNANTINDIIGANCLCAGTLLGNDCEGVPGGPAQPGTACNDSDDCTTGDVYDANCLCAGTFADTDADGTCDADDLCPGGPEPGTACNDNNTCTTGDVIGTNCLCAGTFADADNDGTCDANDLCPGGPEPGSVCNDGNANTTGDVIGTNCICAGVNQNCTEDLVLSISLDAFGSQTTWELRDNATNTVVDAGGPYSDGSPGAVVTTNLCVPVGCYDLVINDAFGDGIVNGGYMLKDDLGRRIIDANGAFPASSSIAIAGGDFCVPLGPTFVKPNWCDRTDLLPSSFIYCQGVAGASGYQFWFFDPHGSYSRRILKPTTECRLNNLQTNPAPYGLALNVRVRPLVGGNYLAFGKTCRLVVNNPGGNFRDEVYFTTDEPHLSMYPNPNRDEVLYLMVEGLSNEATTAEVRIHDAMGKLVISEQVAVGGGTLNHALKLTADLGSGLYLVQVAVDDQVFTERLMRQ